MDFLQITCRSKTEKMNSIEFCVFELVYPKFQFKLKIFDFLDQICPKRVCLVEKRKSQHHHLILNIRISLGTKFHFKQTILNFGTKFAQRVFPVENRKSEHRHGILRIRISIGAKFQLKLTNLISWICFFKRHFIFSRRYIIPSKNNTHKLYVKTETALYWYCSNKFCYVTKVQKLLNLKVN